MSKKSKLLAALDAHRGRDYEAEKRVKQIKAAAKKKRVKAQERGLDFNSAEKVAEKSRSNNDDSQSPPPELEDSFANFSDDDEEAEDASEDGGTRVMQTNAGVESDHESNSDVPLSELSSEDRADTIPHQRLTINKIPTIRSSTKRISLVQDPKMRFSAHNSLVLTSLPPSSTSIPDPNDDLNRELEFYRICRAAVVEGRRQLKKEDVPFTRPSDYFAEMVKSDEQMGRVRKKMYDEAASKKAAAEAKKLREAKKFGKAVQVAKEQERAREKKQTLEKINSLKRKRKDQDTGTVNEGDDLFQSIQIESKSNNNNNNNNKSNHKSDFRRSQSTVGNKNSSSSSGIKRQKRDERYGFGGKKRHSKSGDAISTADLDGSRRGRIGGGGGGGRSIGAGAGRSDKGSKVGRKGPLQKSKPNSKSKPRMGKSKRKLTKV